jgi:hypothetical protein
MRRGQVTQSTDQPQNMTNTMPMEIQHNTTSRQNGIVDIVSALQRLTTYTDNLLGPNPSNGQFARAYEAPSLSPTPTPCAQNVPTCLEYPTIGHLNAGQTYSELTVPDDPFANNDPFADTSYPIVQRPVIMDPKPTHEGDIGKGKKGKKAKKTRKDANKAENIMVDESSTFSGEPEIQHPEIEFATRDGSTANQLDLPRTTRLEHQLTVHFKSPTIPSRVIFEFQKT